MLTKQDIEKLETANVLTLLNSKEELRDWFLVYFNIWFPMGYVYPTSNSSPIEASWRIYELMKTGQSRDIPQVAMHSSRDSFKTLIAAATEVLCMVHFRICVANASSLLSQSEKTVEYINSFFRKLKPHLEAHGWRKNSDNKRKIEWITDKDEVIYVQVLVMSMRGMNSSHLPMLWIDEADLIQDPRALAESAMIPSVYKKFFPLTCILSTLKFSGGIMEKLLDQTKKAGGEIYRWNIIDVTERIPRDLARVDEPKVTRYVSRELPLRNLTPAQWNALQDEEKVKYEKFEAYAGIADHPMLPVMRNYLVDRPQDDVRFLYKPLTAVHNNFKVTPPDMAEAQLLCNKPSSSGLVYPRFDPTLNVLTIPEAWEKVTGNVNPHANFEQLKDFLLSMGCAFVGGADWGYTDLTALQVLALLPGGQIWVVDCIYADKLELEDIVKYAVELQKKWNIDKWFVDQAYPAYIATLRRKGLKVPEFTKVVVDGITALQSRIVDSNNSRRFFLLDIPENRMNIEMFANYKWALDGKGDIIEGKPHHDRDGYSDLADSLRYPMQVLFSKNNKVIFSTAHSDKEVQKPKMQNKSLDQMAEETNKALIQDKMQELIPEGTDTAKKARTTKKILWM